MSLQKIGRALTLFLVGFLPWSVIVSVTCTEQLHIGVMRFAKEILLAVIILVAMLDMWKQKYRPIFDKIDILIGIYVATLIFISFITETTLFWYIYGLRYNAEFFIAFVFFRQIIRFWDIRFWQIGKIFILSGGIMLFGSLLIRYVFWEVFLTIFGYSGQVSVWDGAGPPPIYHGIPGASVVRFQGMLEGPNQMAFFLLIYLGAYISLFSSFKRYRFINVVIILLLIFLLTQTYSRSGLLWFILGFFILVICMLYAKVQRWYFRSKHKNWKKTVLVVLLFFLTCCMIWLQFWSKFHEVIKRSGSTSAHFERMYIGYIRFLEQPLGHGLAQAGPASRAIIEVNQHPIPLSSLDGEMKRLWEYFLARNPDFVMNTEHYYIPESWYIQQLIEGGIIGFFFFALIFLLLLVHLRKYPPMLAALAGVLVMNTFLHSFESVHTALALFLIIASLQKK
jgi:O-antigen ligase